MFELIKADGLLMLPIILSSIIAMGIIVDKMRCNNKQGRIVSFLL